MDEQAYIEDKRKKAADAFMTGKGCTQAVLSAFDGELGADQTVLMRAACGFGGGMSRLREVCGCVSAMCMAEGLLSASGKCDKAEKDAVYGNVRELAAAFKERNGSIVCRELLAGIPITDGAVSEERTPAYYKKRPCKEYCADAAEFIARRVLNLTKEEK